MDQLPVLRFSGDWLVRIEPSVLEKLPSRPCNHKAVVCIIGLGLAPIVDPFAIGVVMVFPDEIIRVGEGVRLEIERPRADKGIARATAEREEQSCCEYYEQSIRSEYFVLHSGLPQKLFVRYLTGKCFTNDGARSRGVAREKSPCAIWLPTGNGRFANWKQPAKRHVLTPAMSPSQAVFPPNLS